MNNGSSVTLLLLVVLTLAPIANMDACDDVNKSATKVNSYMITLIKAQ